jgi:hypothetical protein
LSRNAAKVNAAVWRGGRGDGAQGAKRQKAARRSESAEIKDVKKSYGGKIEVVKAYRKDRAQLVKLRHCTSTLRIVNTSSKRWKMVRKHRNFNGTHISTM